MLCKSLLVHVHMWNGTSWRIARTHPLRTPWLFVVSEIIFALGGSIVGLGFLAIGLFNVIETLL
jgi:hypothetical protein